MTKLRSYVVLSDIHLGARSTTADEILKSLSVFFDDFTAKSQFCDIDVLFIAGDLWDDTITFSSEVLAQFIPWFTMMMNWCARNNIKVRILEGTPRHDRRQGATIEKIVESFLDKVDFKYIPALSIEHIEDLDLRVLYVPDECRPTAEIIARDVQSLLDDHGLEKVDIAIMHGMFKYQMGKIPMNAKVHDEDWYLSRVKYFINIGHVHTASQYNRILAQGSFERLRHGEEEPKGAFLVKETEKGEWIPFFIENKRAKVYKTVEIKGDLEKAYKKIDREIKSLPMGSYVRIQGNPTHPIFQGLDVLKARYPLFIFTVKKVDLDKEKVKEEQDNEVLDYRPIILNRETLTEALFSEVTLRETLTPEEESLLYRLLEELHE